MASKNEYYDRIISSLQSELTSQRSEISELKSNVTRQQKEIEVLKSAGTPPPNSPIRERLTATDKSQLLQQAKKECTAMIQSRLEILPSHYVSKREFDNLRTTITKTYLLTDTFTSYKKRQETRLKSIEEKLTNRISFFSTNPRKRSPDQTCKASISIATIIQFFKNHNPQWLLSIIVCMFIWMLAFFLLSRINA